MNQVNWIGAITLAELIYKMVQEKKIDTVEFKALVKFYGQDKLRELYKEERAKQKGCK